MKTVWLQLLDTMLKARVILILMGSVLVGTTARWLRILLRRTVFQIFVLMVEDALPAKSVHQELHIPFLVAGECIAPMQVEWSLAHVVLDTTALRYKIS